MVINTNVAAQGAARMLGGSSQLLSKSLARLSSGSKLVSPEDDAAGMAVSIRFDAQINRTSAAISNIGNAISFSQTQDGVLKKVSQSLDRMSELAVLAQDVSKTDGDRSLYNEEFQTLASYVNNVVAQEFNGVSLFSTSALSVTTDSEGGTFQMQAIQGNYIAGAMQPGPAVARPLNTVMSDMLPGFAGGDMYAVLDNSGGGGYLSFIYPNTKLTDVVGGLQFVLSISPGGGATYDTQTGQLTVTVGAGQKLTHDIGNPPVGGPDNIFPRLGLHEVDNLNGTRPIVMTTRLTTPGALMPVSAPDISTLDDAKSALTTVKYALDKVAGDRATVGANISRLNLTSDQLSALKDNLSSANSRIKDVDVAQESTQLARYNILVQAGSAMLSQANTMPQSVLRLLS